MSSNINYILDQTRQKMYRISESPANVWNSVIKALRYIFIGRLGITIFLVAWLFIMTILISWRRKPNTNTTNTFYGTTPTSDQLDEEGEGGEGGGSRFTQNIIDDEENYVRYYNLHRVWFGDQSIVWTIFKIWYFTIILWMLSPVLRELVIFLKVRMMF